MLTSGQIAIRAAAVDDLEDIRVAYREWGYRGGIGVTDTVFVAECDEELIGIVRLVEEDGIYVLRGMQVSPSWQRRGIGTALLRQFITYLGGAECYCVPYTHLEEFYAREGFRKCTPQSAPRFLADRLKQYRESGHSVILMRRPELEQLDTNAG